MIVFTPKGLDNTAGGRVLAHPRRAARAPRRASSLPAQLLLTAYCLLPTACCLLISPAKAQEPSDLLPVLNPPGRFRASAVPTRRVSYAEMFQRPATHRGKVVRVEGDVRWVNKLDTPDEVKKAGLDSLYELWIVNKALGPRPYAVLLT